MKGFEKDLFISYAHIDNEPLTAGEKGWITRFHASLEALLSMRLGQRARIWRDDKLRGNDVFADAILDQFGHTAILVSVLTPRYLNSEWCTREVTEFCKAATEQGDIVVENKSRVFKVLKTPVDEQDSLPAAMKDVLGYEFFTYEDGAPLELDSAYGAEYAQAYNRKVAKLASDVSQLLKQLEVDLGTSEDTAEAASKPSVYLAECSYDVKEIRESLEADLAGHGYPVLPDRELPRDESDYVGAVESLLGRCEVSIHVVGTSYGAVPDGPSAKSVVVLQNELAVERARAGALQRVIWLPEGTASKQEPQQAFIDALHQDADTQFGADLITGDIETLKIAIHALLKRCEEQRAARAAPEVEAGTDAKLVYLIFDERDRKSTVPLRKFLRDQGFEVDTPAFGGDAAAIREAQQQSIAACDAVILFYGAGDEAWKRALDSELRKMPGYRDGKPLLASRVYLAEPRTADKDDLIDMEEPGLIDGLDGFSAAAMEEFVQALTGSDGGS